MSYRMQSLVLVLFFLSLAVIPTTLAVKKSYVVYLGAHSHISAAADVQQNVINSHHQLLGSVLGGVEKAEESIFYSYTNNINGFAAILDEDEATELSKHPGVVSVFPNKEQQLHTTRSWEFLGLQSEGKTAPNSLWEKGHYGEDVIIGHLDTGVWPESESFSDEGLGPVPARWKGVCQNATDVNGVKCNRKLIGARYFDKGYVNGAGEQPKDDRSARDSEGHGTHTASTAAGRFVPNASIFGAANGTAKGGSPRARLATYKVCWDRQCFDADILAAFDAAIRDGVDVITLSLGGSPRDYFNDSIAIGSFHAVSRGITVVASAGNDGPMPQSVSNVAPWLITVAASTLDREFVSYLSLGNNKTLQGASLSSSSSLAKKLYPLAKGADVRAANAKPFSANYCRTGTLDPKKVKGKIITCLSDSAYENILKGMEVKDAGGVGMIVCNDEYTGNVVNPEPYFLPATQLRLNDSKELFAYINSTKMAVAYVGPSITKLRTTPAPVMAFFSSRGFNSITSDILKPDITAPGVEILASYNPLLSPSEYNFDKRRSNFTLLSGTSMSCPHVSGIVGLLKNAHPDWSPAAIRSAIMTTAIQQDNLKKPITNEPKSVATPLDYGSGHLHPNGALDPGLVYDINATDYLNFLCAIGYNKKNISLVAGRSYSCSVRVPEVTDLNYPSITISNLEGTKTISRIVKNVGKPGTYTASIDSPPEILVSVRPQTLKFERIGEEKKFTVTVETKKSSPLGFVFGWLNWSDGVHHVRSPISVRIGPI